MKIVRLKRCLKCKTQAFYDGMVRKIKGKEISGHKGKVKSNFGNKLRNLRSYNANVYWSLLKCKSAKIFKFN